MRNASLEHTYALVGIKRLITKSVNLRDIFEIRMLSYKCPLFVFGTVIEVCDADFHTPILVVVCFNVPMNSDWTHVMCTLHKGIIINLRRIFWSTLNPRIIFPEI